MTPRAKAPNAHSVSAHKCRRFWLTRGLAPDLSDDGFLVDPDTQSAAYAITPAFSIESLAAFPVVVLLGEPGMGKTIVLEQDAERLDAEARQGGYFLLNIDMTALGGDQSVCESIFESVEYRRWSETSDRLHLWLDGLDTCLHNVPTLVALLLNRLRKVDRSRMFLHITCRTAEWPADFETGLRELWDHAGVEVFELAPLRRRDVAEYVRNEGLDPDAFLDEVQRVGAHQFANRPITLGFLADSFRVNGGFPSRFDRGFQNGICARQFEKPVHGREVGPGYTIVNLRYEKTDFPLNGIRDVAIESSQKRGNIVL
jgi:hypothetical protein